MARSVRDKYAYMKHKQVKTKYFWAQIIDVRVANENY